MAGPQALGVATADSTDTDTSTGGARGSQSAPAAEAPAGAGRRSGRTAAKTATAANRNADRALPARAAATTPLAPLRQVGAPAAPKLTPVASAALRRAAVTAAVVPQAAFTDPVVQSAAATAESAGSVSAVASGLLTMLGGGGGAPVAGPLAWAALAVSRREFGSRAVGASPAVSVSTGEPAAAQVAATAPATVQSISLPRAGTYGTGTKMTFALNFNQAVEVTAGSAPFVPVQVGFAMLNAGYVSGGGTNRLVFELTLPANNIGAVSIGRVSNELVGDADYPVRIFDFNGLGHEVAPEDVANPKIVNAGTTTAVSDTIPTVDTSAISVDSRGPAVVSYGNNGAITTSSGPLGLTHWTTVTVNFDQPVQIKGAPTIPVTIGGVNDVLTYATGSGTSTLTFTKLSLGAAPGPAAFGTEGQIIDLPTGASITDKFGNSVAVVLGNFKKEPGTLGDPLIVNGNQVVVLGAYYQDLGRVTAAQLDTVMNAEATVFYNATKADPFVQPEPIDIENLQTAPYWEPYQLPEFIDAVNDVQLYRVAYNSTIPEQANRPTLAYGLVAIPIGATGPLRLMSYQHGTLVGKGETPSQSFNWLLDPTEPADLYGAAYETRLNVAQFGGQGYAVMAADYFGVGNSLENDGYISKASQQQACLDMYYATVKLLESQSHTVSNLFLGGWSQGGLVTIDFLEKLEGLDNPITVTKAATASAPADVSLTSNAWYFNPRVWPYSDPNTADAIWLNVVGELSNFSITGYAGYPDSPLQMLGVNYETARAMYMREYTDLQYGAPFIGSTGITVIRSGLANVVFPYKLQEVIAPQYSAGECTTTCSTPENAIAFSQTEYAQLLASSGAGAIYLKAPVGMYYGQQDEVIPLFAGTAVYQWQQDSFNKTDIWAPEVAYANHRGTFLAAVRGELEWFNGLSEKPEVIPPTQPWPLPTS